MATSNDSLYLTVAVQQIRGYSERVEKRDNLWNALGITYREWGKADESLAHYAEAESRYQHLGQLADVADVLLDMGRTRYEAHDYSAATPSLQHAIEVSQHIAPQTHLQSLRWLAVVQARLGDSDQADQAITQAKQSAQLSDFIDVQAACHAASITICATRDNLPDARQALDKASELYRQIGDELGIADAEIELAKAEAVAGNPQLATMSYARAAETYRRFNRFHRLAKTQRAMGALLLEADDPHARQTLLEAAQLFDACDCSEDARAIRQKLGSPPAP